MNLINRKKEKTVNSIGFQISYGAYAFAVGLFVSLLDILVHVVFFRNFGYRFLASSYVISGLLGFGVSYTYSSLFKKVSMYRLMIYVLGLVSLLAGAYIVLLGTDIDVQAAYIGMVILFPINAILLLSMRRYGRVLLRGQATKTLFPVVKIGLFLGIAVGGLAVLSLIYLTSLAVIWYLLSIALLMLWPAFILLHRTGKHANLFNDEVPRYVPVKNNLLLFFSSKLSAYLMMFSILSAVVAIIIHFAFINAAWVGFLNVVGMTKFYGLYTAVSVVFIFGIDRYIVKRVLFSYDSPYSILVISPLIMLTLLIAVVGYFLLGGVQAHEHFTLFFLLLIMSKVGYTAGLMAIQQPSLRTLYHSMDIRFRQVAYAHIEGFAPMIGLSASGVFILALSYLKFYNLTVVLIFALVIVLLWMWVTVQLIRAYRKSQEKNLSQNRFKKVVSEDETMFLEGVRKIISSDDEGKIVEALQLTELHHPLEYEANLKQLLSHSSVLIRQYVIDCIEKDKLDSALPMLIEQANAFLDDNYIYERAVQNFKDLEKYKGKDELIRQKVYSGTTEERANMALVLSHSEMKEKDSLLASLSQDYEAPVRHTAVKVMARKRTGKFSYSLLDFLYPGQFDPYAIDAIASSGDSALDFLEREFLIPGTHDIVLARIMRLYGKIGSERSVTMLLSKLGNVNDYVMMHSIQELIERRFRATKGNKFKIQGLLVKLVAKITYNLHVGRSIEKSGKFQLLHEAYLQEIKLNYTHLFRLLSLIYNPNIVNSLQSLFMLGSRTQISHAIELADQYMDADIKPLIFPLLEDLTLDERIKKLELYFPQAKQNLKEILSNLLTQDYNQLSLYPRACAMLEIYTKQIPDFESELVFNTSHPETILSETAAFVLRSCHPEKYAELMAVRWGNEKIMPETRALTEDNSELLLINVYTRLREFKAFQSLSEFVVLQLSRIAKRIELPKGETFSIELIANKYKLLIADKDLYSPVLNGTLNSAGNILSTKLMRSSGVLGARAQSNTTIWLFKAELVDELIYDNVDLANAILKGVEIFKLTTSDD